MVCQWFGLKTTRTVLSGLTSKPVATVSLGLASKPMVEGFPVWTSKLAATSLVIWASKSPRQFLGLGLKTKQASVCRLRHKTDGRMELVRGTHRDLVACFTWKQVGLGFPTLASRLEEVQWRMVHMAPSRRSRVDEDEDRRVDVMGYVRLCYPCFVIFYVLGLRGVLVFYLGL
jgi:hypothetical protein